jgi:hypothetical protein
MRPTVDYDRDPADIMGSEESKALLERDLAEDADQAVVGRTL